MTENLTVLNSDDPAPSGDVLNISPTPPRRSWPIVTGGILAAVALVATGAYGVVQHNHASNTADQLAATKHTLTTTRHTLGTTRSALVDAHGSLGDAKAQLEVCSVVGKAANELYDASSSLIDAVTDVLDENFSTTNLEDAEQNVTSVKDMLDEGGYDNITDLIDACDGTGTGTGI